MATTARDIPLMLESRRYDARSVLDNWVAYESSYREWNDRVRIMDQILRNDWHMVWPDQKVDRALPKVPNYPLLAMEHRARLLGGSMPTIRSRPESLKEKAKQAAELRERILMGYWGISRVPLEIPYWGQDLMSTGVAVTKVVVDFGKPKAERFPIYARLDPRTCYPSPIFAQGPFLDDCVIAYESTLGEVKWRWSDEAAELDQMMHSALRMGADASTERVRVYEFYSTAQGMVVVEPLFGRKPSQRSPNVTVMDELHELGKCPVVIGTRPSHDGAYRGDFDHMLAMLNTSNRLMTLHLDAAARKVYATLIVDEEVENPRDEGPGALLTVKSSVGGVMSHVGWLQHPASAYDGYNVQRQLDSAIRTAVLLPPSVTGNPDESVISAAGINATQSMPNAEVVSLQRDSLAPMLQAANEVALRWDERWCDTSKTITGMQQGAPFAEEYEPSKDIAGNYANEVVYGIGAGQDPISFNVMLLQNKGEGMISERTARDMSPIVENSLREEQLIATETMTKAAFSAIVAGAAAPPGDPRALTVDQITAIWEDLEKPEGSLKDALRNHLKAQQTALAPVPETGSPALASPGAAGVGEPQQPPPFTGAPPLEELLA